MAWSSERATSSTVPSTPRNMSQWTGRGSCPGRGSTADSRSGARPRPTRRPGGVQAASRPRRTPNRRPVRAWHPPRPRPPGPGPPDRLGRRRTSGAARARASSEGVRSERTHDRSGPAAGEPTRHEHRHPRTNAARPTAPGPSVFAAARPPRGDDPPSGSFARERRRPRAPALRTRASCPSLRTSEALRARGRGRRGLSRPAAGSLRGRTRETPDTARDAPRGPSTGIPEGAHTPRRSVGKRCIGSLPAPLCARRERRDESAARRRLPFGGRCSSRGCSPVGNGTGIPQAR